MLSLQFQTYTGKRPKEGFSGGFVESDLIVILTIEDGLDYEKGVGILNNLKTELMQRQPDSLSSFESALSELVVKLNFPAHFNLAAGLLQNDVLYVKTVGSGQIYFRRGQEFDLLMEGDKSASGELQQSDFAIFTTSRIKEMIGGPTDLKAFIGRDKPNTIVEKLHDEEYEEEEEGFIAVFTEFTSTGSTVDSTPSSNMSPPESTSVTPVASPSVPASPAPAVPPPEIPTSSVPVIDPLNNNSLNTDIPPNTIPVEPPTSAGFTSRFSGVAIFRSKKLNIIIVIILFGILLWSVVFGYQRRQAALLNTKVAEAREQIEAKLTEAEEEAFLNLEKSLSLIEEAKSDLSTLEKEVGSQKADDIQSIAKLISDTEAKITKKEEKAYEEFYDLALEQEDATGIALSLDEDKVAMLDSANKSIYVLSLDQKSLDEYTASDVSGATLVALYSNKIYFFHPTKGIYEFTSTSKAENVIEADDDWGNIVDMEVYSGNIYLLDNENDEIYKYSVIADGFADKVSYFTSGESVDLSGASGLSIDSSIYIAKGSELYKYTSGVQQDFETSYPNEEPSYNGVYTNPEIEQVYGWDTGEGTIYVLGKDGKYDRQLASSIVTKSKGIFVYDQVAYVFDGQKIYTISLE